MTTLVPMYHKASSVLINNLELSLLIRNLGVLLAMVPWRGWEWAFLSLNWFNTQEMKKNVQAIEIT